MKKFRTPKYFQGKRIPLPGNYQSPGRDYVQRIMLTDPQGQVAAQQDVTVKGHVSTSRDTKTILQSRCATPSACM
jgi:hypothetical protein